MLSSISAGGIRRARIAMHYAYYFINSVGDLSPKHILFPPFSSLFPSPPRTPCPGIPPLNTVGWSVKTLESAVKAYASVDFRTRNSVDF